LREAMILQSKCGIRNGYFDFSKDYIVSCVDNSLKRLHTDYLDILLLHRPDMLMEPEEVAAAFDQLYTSGKVRYFGVSNHTPNQIALLQKYCTQKIVINQLQLSAAHTLLFDANIALNMANDQGINRDSGVLDYCRLHDITIQAWSPFQKSSKGIFLGDFEHFGELNQKIEELAKKYEVSTSAIAVAFITRHPANIQVILGTTNCDRMIESCQGSDIPLTREEWYGLYKASGHIVP
ncbi:MAG: aldo/keto reductase, partial [Lachnospiraceae bacterium]|nr:aldo/keto reductase [Lachnospiraceae bacterium]